VDAAIGFPRSGWVVTQDIAYGQHSLAGTVTELYEREVMALFNDGDLLPSDCWYGQRHDTKKGRRRPRLTSGLRLLSGPQFF
jgi:hypothetical protein